MIAACIFVARFHRWFKLFHFWYWWCGNTFWYLCGIEEFGKWCEIHRSIRPTCHVFFAEGEVGESLLRIENNNHACWKHFNYITIDGINPNTLCENNNIPSQGFLRLQISYEICHFIRECRGPSVGDKGGYGVRIGLSLYLYPTSIHMLLLSFTKNFLSSCYSNLHWHSGNIGTLKGQACWNTSSSSPTLNIFLMSALCF